jgi:hypothetical protein
MGRSCMRPETREAEAGKYAPTGGTAYLMIYNAVRSKQGLIAGALHKNGEACAIGSYFDANPRTALDYHLIDEVAAVNDSGRSVTPRQRRLIVLRWLRWKLKQAGMPGFEAAKIAK